MPSLENHSVQKLGKNQGAYHGETIELLTLLGQLTAAAQARAWSIESFFQVGDLNWYALQRNIPPTACSEAFRRIYISAGIHGDEPAGPLAALRLIEADQWPGNSQVFLLPCLNPIGFLGNRRENAEGKDLNRDYRHLHAAEVRAHISWLERQPKFDLYFCLHEDWESPGFYLYEQNPDRQTALGRGMIDAVREVCPNDCSETIEGRRAELGVIHPAQEPGERADWPEAFYMITHKARLGYTLEAPSDFPLATRVNALVRAVHAALGVPAGTTG